MSDDRKRLQAAIRWRLRLAEVGADPALHAQFERWLAASPANAAACIRAGAAGVAVVSAVFGEGVDTVAATAELRRIVDGALAEREKR